MENLIIEATYPIEFRSEDAKALGNYLKGRHSVMLIGMKRVGISNFLRFFLNHKDIIPTYISKTEKHLLIPVDLNDLVEREIFPFWILTLKRIVDEVEKSEYFDKKVKKEIEHLFLDGIQSKNLFLLMDAIRQSISRVIQSGVLPSLFFLRFDRMKDAATSEFFNNLQGLKDGMHGKLSYVFTSFRDLPFLAPKVFTKSSLSLFSHDLYIKPAGHKDVEIVSDVYQKQYSQKLSGETKKALFDIVDGYIQYLQLSLIILRHKGIDKKDNLFSFLAGDEQIYLQSEELWESLTAAEQDVLVNLVRSGEVDPDVRRKEKYLWDTGLLYDANSKTKIFSPLFSGFVGQKEKNMQSANGMEFTKKENLLFSYLKEHENEICEREAIIEAVWSEVTTLGVTDWAIDRLVARVRNKLKGQNSNLKIQTVKTRGYKLISDS